jgi:2',3'-cyclic-nucleotide 2'-phosphodiesterase/3'-nucleotidase
MRPRSRASLIALLALLSATARADEARLVILHTTDLHGALTAYDYIADRPAARGLVKIASLVDSVRASGVPTVLVDAGDAIEGGGIETVYQSGDRSSPDPMMTAMSRMGYDAMAVGNHEFNFGPAVLERARATARFPLLAANIVHAGDGRGAFAGSIVKQAGRVRVGIIGLITPAVPSWEDPENYAGFEFLAPVPVAQREARRLRQDEHCDVIVLLAHSGLERDTAAVSPARGARTPSPDAASDDTPDENWGYRLATQVPDADVVVLGHTHVQIPSLQIGTVIAAQAGKSAECLGRIDLTLQRADSTARWTIVSRRSRLVPVTDATPANAALSAFAAPYDLATQTALRRVIGHASSPLEAPSGRLADNALWELIHGAQLEASNADVSLAAMFDPGQRIAAGPVTVRDALRLYPYANTLAVVKLTGAQLKDVLEHSAGYFATYTYEAGHALTEPGRQGYNFDAARGVSYEIDLTRPKGERIVNLARQGRPLAAAETLRVAVNNYRVNGGGGYPHLHDAPRVWRTPRSVRDLIVASITKARTLDGGVAPSWSLLPDYVSHPERPQIDRLVRQGVAPANEVFRLGADEVARRGDLAYWLARAFGWRESKRSYAYPDVPDSLEPWLDGLLKRKVLGEIGTLDRMNPFAVARLAIAEEWCERAARRAGYQIAPTVDASFRHGLVQGLSAPGASDASIDTLTRAQVLGIVANLRYPQLRVLETTDFHGAILGGRDRASDRAVGGSAVLAAYVAKLRAENPEGTVLLDGGDFFQGTMISNLQFGRPVVEQMNAIGYTAVAIGNHEFDWSADTLARRVTAMRFHALAANMHERKSGRIPRWAHADTVVTRRGVRVGILGLCYHYTPTVTMARNVAHLRFDDDSATAARLVPALRKRSDVVVGVGHIPCESDSLRRARGGDLVRLARGVPGVAAWFGGHSHNLVRDQVQGVPVMIAGALGEAVAVCDLVVDPVRDTVIESRTELVRTFADQVEPDSTMKARVARWNASVAPIASQPLGQNLRTLRRNRGGEGAVGNLVADAMRAATGADVALQNSGGLRSDLPEGTVTRGTIYEVMPFDNQLVTLELTGAQVKIALEQALRWGRVTQVSGIKYSFDLDRPVMGRVIGVLDATGAPLDSARVYKVTVNDFMATGGDDYDVLSHAPHTGASGALVRDALESFVAARTAHGAALDYKTEGRITRVGRRPERAED